MHLRVALPIIACFAASVVPASAQHLGHARMQTTIIDGSKTPEQITDFEAYDLWFVALAEPNDGSAEAAQRLDAKLSPLVLNAADRAALATVMDEFKGRYDAILAQRTSESTQTRVPMDQSRADEQNLVAATEQSLQTSLSPAAWNRLKAWIEGHVKRSVKVYVTQH